MSEPGALPGTEPVSRTASVLLSLAAVAVAFAAADTYVVVLALPNMMTSVGIPIDQLQRAAPIVSGFLLGYVAMLPLIGRIADLRGRVPVLLMSLVVFSIGSLITASSYDLTSLVGGRFLQGVGGGGLVPATLALVADLYPAHRRGVPLGIVSAVQEIGSVLGPLFGAAVLAVASWRAIFMVNLAVGAVLAVAIRRRASGHQVGLPRITWRLPDPVGLLLGALTLAAGAVAVIRPAAMMRDLTVGEIFVPYAGDGRWWTPIGTATLVLVLALLVRCWFASRPLVDLRGWFALLRQADLVGAVLLALTLAGVILAFATADPQIEVFSAQGEWFLAGSLVAAALFVLHTRRAETPLIPPGALHAVPAWGALLVSFFVGAALIAALIDIPLFARTTTYLDSQLQAALVLVRFLIALPVGAVIGGFLTRRLPVGVISAAGMALAAVGFLLMAQWGEHSLTTWGANVPLLVGGLGFGLALAPVNAALLASTADDVHGVVSALVVVARMVGMLVGISALTTIGLRRFYDAPASLTAVERAITQEHAVFQGAAVCAAIAGVLALALFVRADTRALDTGAVLRTGG
jgi:MFS family permease